MGEIHTLLLHIGLPKTGTSALQRFLFYNTEILKEYGWSYPDLKTIIGTADSYYIEYINATVLHKAENVLDVHAENWIRSWNFLKKELEKYNVILSSEILFDWKAVESLLTEIKKEHSNVKVIIYLRRQDLFIESYWAQLVKSDNYVRGFEESVQELAAQYAHYLELLYSISRIIGKDNLIVRVYEKGQYKGDGNDIFSDFLDALGVNPDRARFREVGIVNQSLFGNYLEIKRIFNFLTEIDDTFSQDYKIYFLKLVWSMPKEKRAKGFFPSKEKRDEFLKQFEEENKIIAEQFVHNDDGILFYDTNTDIPFSGVSATKFEEDLIKLFGTIICTEVKEIKHRLGFLEKNSKKTTEEFINLKRGDRKIAYFGCGQKCKELLKKYCLDVELILDNDKKKAGNKIDDIFIKNPLSIDCWEEWFIIVTCIDADDIVRQLEALGLHKDKDFMLANEFLY